MKSKFIYKYNVVIEDSTNLRPIVWKLVTYIQAENIEESEDLLQTYYKNATILDYELIDTIQCISY